ncbi:type 1 fimbrial protein [Pseudomonas putida]|uniref:fimbrial protein n=1 Tax=Pseudomonas putida group TaxID=136845 RepID=UPI00105A7BEF|nr:MULTISPECIES: fimbrial protein [Pseudomonas putida group]MBF8748343.1 fimbrial protein [Pseudomonas monteilii]TDJ73322.1 type 1 fimbrial protein [Pseudomonas putida]
MKPIFALFALSLASGSAMANTGIINFEGTVTAGGTCPIDVVTPGGPSKSLIYLGDFKDKDFTTVGQKTPIQRFGLRHDPSKCPVTPGQKAFVKFSANYGAGPSDLYQLQSGVGYSEGMALAILDKSNSVLAPDTESVGYDLSDRLTTDMNFTTYLQTIDATVTEGQIATSVNFTVDIR